MPNPQHPIWLLVAATLAAAAAGAAIAAAPALGDYTITQCGGSPAPAWQDGFSGYSGALATSDFCQDAAQQFVFVYPGTNLVPTAVYGAEALIPSSMPDLSITHLLMNYALPGDLGPDEAFLELQDSAGQVISGTQYGTSASTGVFNAGVSSGRGYELVMNCAASDGSGGCNMTSQATFSIGATTVTIHDTGQPQVAATGGTLLSGGPQQGTQTLTFTAADDDSGVQQVAVSLGSQLAGENEYANQCVDTQWQPCPPKVSDVVQVDTTTVADGTYPVLVTATSYGGETTTVQAGTVVVKNDTTSVSQGTLGAPPGDAQVGAANGSPASAQAHLSVAWAGSSRAVLAHAAYAAAQTVKGVLTTPTGQPIAGATVLVRATPAYGGARTTSAGQAQTAANGTFTYRSAGRLSSRTLTFSYDAHTGDATPSATAQVSIAVSAPVVLNVEPRVSQVGGTITFSGRLPGGPLPPGGKLLTLQARQAVRRGRHYAGVGSWITFRQLRTSARGAFSARYRFRLPGPIDYEFRAVSAAESDYPYAAGDSSPVVVRER
ncbi:MAG TPA: carboxypeptidase-like regulatory domain-containing protein [Solirubrobacteraceae bacterium]|jgi:hypothetical protein|nr:carboxypeptidase-like regulatory domain-containing protein [Solirubrobacteraceae bacterium]